MKIRYYKNHKTITIKVSSNKTIHKRTYCHKSLVLQKQDILNSKEKKLFKLFLKKIVNNDAIKFGMSNYFNIVGALMMEQI